MSAKYPVIVINLLHVLVHGFSVLLAGDACCQAFHGNFGHLILNRALFDLILYGVSVIISIPLLISAIWCIFKPSPSICKVVKWCGNSFAILLIVSAIKSSIELIWYGSIFISLYPLLIAIIVFAFGRVYDHYAEELQFAKNVGAPV